MNARPAREANRLKQYDYSQAGNYFVTICIQDRVCLLGDIVNDNMILNDAGKMIENSWRQSPEYYDGVEIDSCQIMPNHLHGIITIDDQGRGGSRTAPISMPRKPLGRIIGAFKTVSTKRINLHRRTPSKPIWQRNYFEHIVRNDKELTDIREYIVNNPIQWELDKYNPEIQANCT